jgi:hypothetical protein
MSSVVGAALLENNAPLAKGRQPTKFTPENIAKIRDWMAQGVGREEIANRLEVSVGSLQVTCSRLGISLRKHVLAKGNGAIQQRTTEDIWRGDHAARAKFTLLIQTQNRQAAGDLPLRQDLINQLVLEAAVRDQTIANLIAKIVRQVLEKDLVEEILRNDNSPSKV